MKLKYLFFVLCLFCVRGNSVFSLTPKEEKGVRVLKSPKLVYESPEWFTPFPLEDAPQSLDYRLSILPYESGSAQSYLVIPTLGLITPVIYIPEHSSDYRTMRAGEEIDINLYLVDGVLHYASTAYPNQEGNMVIFGHSNFFKDGTGKYKTIFADLMNLDVSERDELWLFDKNPLSEVYELLKYRITASYETVPTDVGILQPQGGKELTVFACTNGLAGRWIVRTEQIPDDEVLVPYRMKFRLSDLLQRFSALSREQQETIRTTLGAQIESVKIATGLLPDSYLMKFRRYLLNYIENRLIVSL